MSFLNPWVALGIAAAVIPALLLLYFLKLRRREQTVPSTLLWKRAVQDLQVNAPFQRLRKNLLLVLQLLVLGAAITALARPIVQSTAAVEGKLVILIDRSASMNTREGRQTRLDLAKEQATRLVRTLNRRNRTWYSFLGFGGAAARTQAMVIAFADRATVVAPFTSHTTDLLDAINGISPTDGRTRIREALELAEAYMAPPTRVTDEVQQQLESTPFPSEAPARLVLISDGAIADLNEIVLRQGTLELVKIGQTRDNVAITALRTERNYERPETVEVFLKVENFGDLPVTTDVSIYLDGRPAGVRDRTVTLAPAPDRRGRSDAGGGAVGDTGSAGGGGEADASAQELSFELTLDRPGLLEARLWHDDALMADNRAYAVVPPARKLRVLVVTEGNIFLDSALLGLPLEARVFVTPAQYERGGREFVQEGHSVFDVVVFDKVQPATLPKGSFLFLGAVPKVDEVETAGVIDVPHALIWWDDTHPVLRHVALEYVYVAADAALTLKVPGPAETLIEGPRGPALACYAHAGRHYLILSFPVEASTWWLKSSWAVFMHNAIRYLGAGGATAEQGPTRPGEPLLVTLPEGVTEAEFEAPDPNEARLSLKPDAAGMLHYDRTNRAGVYRVRYTRDDRAYEDLYAVNIEDAWESDIRPRGAEALGSPQVTAGQVIETATPEVWRWFVGLALVIALIEWYVYNRRVIV